MIIAPGPSTITFRGREVVRWRGFVDLNSLVCPDEHRVKTGGFTVLEHAGLRCGNKAVAGGGECGALIWVLFIPGPGPRLFYGADVEHKELQFWMQEHYGLEEIMRYLGAWFTRGDGGRADRRRTQ